jgi:type VI secretion system secreted protein Hcp
MQVEGEVQGMMDGECNRKDLAKWIECLAFRHEISSPRDPHTGQATGHRQHHLLTITKEFDSSSPMLCKALVMNEKLKLVTIKWYRPSPTGVEQHFYTMKLENAFVCGVKPWIPNVLDPVHKTYTNMEDISFVYGKIQWTHEVAGKEAEDDWLSPGA